MTTVHAAQTMHRQARPVARAVNVVIDFLRVWKNRREIYRLGEMSDYELADIGLSRADLHVVTDLPFGSDPTERLGALADRRRSEAETMVSRIS